MSNKSALSVTEAVSTKIDSVRTRSLDVSFNEILDMYQADELRIDPEYQRLFRWSEAKQSRFIESLVLELPVPPIFVIELEDGRYELIDGLQRISSYLHFRNIKLPFADLEMTDQPLILSDCDIVTELNGLSFETMPKSLEIKLKRNFVRMEVIRKESDPRLRYYMFKRLNTGGELLSSQEIRNCTIRLLDPTFNNFLAELSKTPDFIACTVNLTDDRRREKFDQELVLRFFSFKNDRGRYRHDVGDFMTEYMEAVSDPARTDVVFDYDTERAMFLKTFKILNSSIGDAAFSGVNSLGRLVATFLSYHYEAFTLGIQDHIERLNPEDSDQMSRLKNVLTQVKNDAVFRDLTQGGGKNYPRPLEARINFVRDAIPSDL